MYTKEELKKLRHKYYIKHRKKRLKRQNDYYLKNREEILPKMRNYNRAKRDNDPIFLEKERARHREVYKRFRKKHYLMKLRNKQSEKGKLRSKYEYAIRCGKLIRPKSCESCKIKCRPDGHHWNGYENYLDVVWLCTVCHGKSHRIK